MAGVFAFILFRETKSQIRRVYVTSHVRQCRMHGGGRAKSFRKFIIAFSWSGCFAFELQKAGAQNMQPPRHVASLRLQPSNNASTASSEAVSSMLLRMERVQLTFSF